MTQIVPLAPPSRLALVLGVAACGLLGMPGGARGEPPRTRPPLTALEAGPLARADLVVVGRVEEVRLVRGLALAQVGVEKRLKGPAVPDTLSVLVRGPRPSADPTSPSTPYLEPGARGRYALFLVRGPGGAAWQLDTLFQIEGLLGLEKQQSLEKIAELQALQDPDARARAVLAHLLEALADGRTWTRVNAARELNHAARARPELFDARVRQRLHGAHAACQVPAERAWLRRLLEALAETPAQATPPPAAAGEPQGLQRQLEQAPDEASRVQVLQTWLARGGASALPQVLERMVHESAAVRIELLRAIGEGRFVPAERVRALYATEESPEVQGAIVRAVGLLGGDADVPWLEARLTNLRLEREVLFALARIRTPLAVGVLASERERAATGGEAAKDTLALLDYLLGPAFEQAEREAGRDPAVLAR